MAMSRSLGAIWLTTLPPMRSSPSLMSSSPAIMFSVVDLPHPDGPTRIMNSPSAMSRLKSFTASAPSGKRLVTWLRVISAMSLSLHGAGGEPGDDAPLEEQHEEHDRDGDDHRGGGDRSRRLLELRAAGEERDGGRHGSRVVARRQRDRQQELVPGDDEHQDRRREHSRRGQWGDDSHERLVRRRAVDLGRLLQLPRYFPEERRQRIDGQ